MGARAGAVVIDDPDDPDYRYPEPGERFWHVQWDRWVIVRPTDGWCLEQRAREAIGLRILGEVTVELEDTGQRGIVKLRSLEERNP